MSIGFQLVFTGLCLFCTQDKCNVANAPASVFLVNATETAKACEPRACKTATEPACPTDLILCKNGAPPCGGTGHSCNGGVIVCKDQSMAPCGGEQPYCQDILGEPMCFACDNNPLLKHTPQMLIPVSLLTEIEGMRLTSVAGPGGEEYGLLDLRGMCLNVGDDSLKPLVRATGRDEDQRVPGMGELEERFFDWILSIQHIDSTVDDLKDEVKMAWRMTAPASSAPVISRLNFFGGTLYSTEVKRWPQSADYVQWLGCPDHRPSSHPQSMPHALGGGVALDIRAATLRLTSCLDSDQYINLDARGGTGVIYVSNLPNLIPGIDDIITSEDSLTGLDHFRWFYELVEWRFGHGCPDELAVPTHPEVRHPPVNYDCSRDAGTGNMFCPPTTYP